MNHNPNAEDQLPGKKLAQSMSEFPLKDGLPDLHQAGGIPMGAGSGGAALAAGLKRSMLGEPASASARIAGELSLSKGIDAGGFAAYHASARKPAIAQPDPPLRNAGTEEVRRIQEHIIRREQLQRLKQETRAEEALELQRRAVAASETALEEERERTREARVEAAVQTKARKKADRLALLGIVVGVVGALIGAWPYIKDQL